MLGKSLACLEECLEEAVGLCWRIISNRRQIERRQRVPGLRERLDYPLHEGKDLSEPLFSPHVTRRQHHIPVR